VGRKEEKRELREKKNNLVKDMGSPSGKKPKHLASSLAKDAVAKEFGEDTMATTTVTSAGLE